MILIKYRPQCATLFGGPGQAITVGGVPFRLVYCSVCDVNWELRGLSSEALLELEHTRR